MKHVKKKDEVAKTNLIICTRYGHLGVLSKDEPALCSLNAVANYLKLPYEEVRRLYRKFFLKTTPP